MQDKTQSIITGGEPTPESNQSFLETAAPAEGCSGERRPPPVGGCLDILSLSEEEVPRLVIRGKFFRKQLQGRLSNLK